MSAYYAAPGADPAAVTGQEELAPVLVAFAGPAAQSRWTVLIRILMVIPHLIVLWALAIAAYVVVIIGWFGALFTGRLPAFAADYLAGFVRWQTRVFGYAILLTDAYPPFTLEDADYPIRVAVRPGRLNRLAVLFRFFLLIPAWIVQTIVSYGAFTHRSVGELADRADHRPDARCPVPGPGGRAALPDQGPRVRVHADQRVSLRAVRRCPAGREHGRAAGVRR